MSAIHSSFDKQPGEKSTELNRSSSKGIGEVVISYHDQQTYNLSLVNDAMETVGMGRYQWQMCFTCGFGFVVDQLLLISISLVMPQVQKEFAVQYPKMVSLALYAGLFFGAIFTGLFADIFGRSLIWQLCLFGVSIWATICAAAPNFAALAVFVGLMGLFGGGNLAIDLTLFCEVLPRNKSWILTLLATMWGVGNAIQALIGWPLIDNFSCPENSTPQTCHRSENMGWRYLYITSGLLCLAMAVIRVFVLKIEESPKWLVANGKFDAASISINRIARLNRSDFTISADRFQSINLEESKPLSWDVSHIKGLFRDTKRAISTSGVFFLWMGIGIAYPIYSIFLAYYLAAHGANLGDGSTYQTYRDVVISSVVGIFGPALAAWMIEIKFLGRRRSMAILAIITGAFAGAFTSVKSEAQNLAFSCMINFWQNGFYGVLYAYTPEVMPTAHRGTGCGLAMAMGRLASISSPFIATFANTSTPAPLWICMSLYFVMALVALILPYEPRDVGKEGFE